MPRKSPSANRLDGQLCFALYKATNAITRVYRGPLAAIGLTYLQYLVLLVRWEDGRQSVGGLAQRLDLDASTLTPLLKRMQGAGLLERHRVPDNQRVVRVELTARGKALQKPAAATPRQGVCAPPAAGPQRLRTQGNAPKRRRLAYKVMRRALGHVLPLRPIRSNIFERTSMRAIDSLSVRPWAAAAALLAGSLASPSAWAVDPVRMVDAFEATNGKFEGYRRSGAKGVCASGEFIGSAEARGLSTAAAFSGKPVPVIVRFSVGGANPKAADNTKGQRNLALQFDLPGGETWQMGNISAPVFGASSPEQLLGRVESLRPDPASKAADPAKVKAFADANPEVLMQGRYFASQPVPASFAAINYWGVHGFGFVNAQGKTQYGKWIFEPVGGVQGLSDDEAKAKGANFLFDELRQRVKAGAVDFDFNLVLAEPGDKIDSATVPLPEGRRKVTLGRLKVTAVSEDSGGPCVAITFNPMVLPKGVVPTDDPMLAARAAPYAVSLGRRLGEGAKQ